MFGRKREEPEISVEQNKLTQQAIKVIDPWICPANMGTNTAQYFKVFNGTLQDNTLFSIDSELANIV
ncbi:MAG: hypothetical protein A2V66_09975 [Ignavibacteria bacterium RBG_13_36_8]|nr:MAG: hypothetical protein A2V66_09975 [Ignavibacteria bacterium RBG_13_36_8]